MHSIFEMQVKSFSKKPTGKQTKQAEVNKFSPTSQLLVNPDPIEVNFQAANPRLSASIVIKLRSLV